jgi:hypothetical protein
MFTGYMAYRANQLSAIGLAAQVAITGVQAPDKNGFVAVGFTNTGHAAAQDVAVALRHQAVVNPPDTYDPFAVDAANVKEIAHRAKIMLKELRDAKADEQKRIDALNAMTIGDEQRRTMIAALQQQYEQMASDFSDTIPQRYRIPELDENVTVTLIQQLKFPPDQTVFAYCIYTYRNGVPRSKLRHVPFCLRYTNTSVESCLTFLPLDEYLKEEESEPNQ